MTHKDEKCQKQCSTVYVRMRVNTPIFGLKCPYRCVQCPDGRVLGWSGWKTAQKCLLEGPKVFQIFFWGGGMLLSPPQNPQILPKIHYFWQFLMVLGGRRGIPSPIFFSKILLILLEDVFGRFSNLTNLEPFHLDIEHIFCQQFSQ